jgi:hypothetical protein
MMRHLPPPIRWLAPAVRVPVAWVSWTAVVELAEVLESAPEGFGSVVAYDYNPHRKLTAIQTLVLEIGTA